MIGRFLCWLANSHVPRQRFGLIKAGLVTLTSYTYYTCERCGREL